jgi:hypothetical protein
MFKQGIYQIVPPLDGWRVVVALIWALGVLVVSIGLNAAQISETSIPTPAPIVQRSPFSIPEPY